MDFRFFKNRWFFWFKFNKKKNKNLNYKIIPMIRIYQDVNSLIVLNGIKDFLNCGYILKPSKGRNVVTLIFYDRLGINKIIKICKEIPLLGAKKKYFLDFSKAYNLYLNKKHLNSTGFKEIVKIAHSINSRRKFD
jgi:hypothetical protein